MSFSPAMFHSARTHCQIRTFCSRIWPVDGQRQLSTQNHRVSSGSACLDNEFGIICNLRTFLAASNHWVSEVQHTSDGMKLVACVELDSSQLIQNRSVIKYNRPTPSAQLLMIFPAVLGVFLWNPVSHR
jgi:hypothetical protein